MTGIFLSAGRGSRLKMEIPKCLIDISGKCSLGRMLENFRYSGIKKIVIITGYKGNMIQDYAWSEEFWDLDIEIYYNATWETTNNAYSLQLALEKVEDDILVCNGDVICYKDLIKTLVDFPSKNAMAVVRKKELNEEDMKVNTMINNEVLNVSKDLDIKNSYGEFTGIFKLEKVLIESLKRDLYYELEQNKNIWFEDGLVGFINDRIFKICDVTHYPYIEIDFPEDLEEARDRFPYNDPVWEQGGRHQSLKENKRDLNDALALMVDFRDILNKYGIRYWLNWGLLLGCVRDGHPLQQDTDLDICIDKENEELLWEKVVPEMKKLRCFVPNREEHYNNDSFIIRDGERIECNTVEKIGDRYIYSPERCKLSCPAHHIDTLIGLTVMGELFMVPSTLGKYLTGWYGDWKTPSNTKPKSFN